MQIIGNDTGKVFQVLKSLIRPPEKTGSHPKSNQELPGNLNQSGGPVICVKEKSFGWQCRERMN